MPNTFIGEKNHNFAGLLPVPSAQKSINKVKYEQPYRNVIVPFIKKIRPQQAGGLVIDIFLVRHQPLNHGCFFFRGHDDLRVRALGEDIPPLLFAQVLAQQKVQGVMPL